MSIDTSKIIHGVVGGGRYTVTSPIVKEDYGLYLKIEGLELPSTYEVDFSNSEHNGTSVTMIGNSDGVLIPHQFIDSGKDVFAFLYHVGTDFGRTVYKFRIPNKLRPDRTDETPTPEEQSTIDQAINALNNAVEQTSQDVISAYESAQNASVSADRAERSESASQLWAETAENYSDSAEQSASQASASATASAQSASQSAQIKDDVEGMVDDARGYATASAQSASASANSASQASGYATSASQSASSAQGYASQAQTSAQTASSKAQDASTSAQTASQKATEASQSASLALAYKTDAESAKTASQTAQGLAESARDSAISAKNDAEDARDEAQSIVDGINAKAEQIDQNTADIASLEEDIYKPYATNSASGAIVSFTDGADDIPLKSLTVTLEPQQDTSQGEPSPENICPITGHTGFNLYKTGGNLITKEFPEDAFLGTFASGSSSISSAGIAHCYCVYVGKNTDVRYYKEVNTQLSMSLAFTDEYVTDREGVTIYGALAMANRSSTVLNSGEHPYLIIQMTDATMRGTGFESRKARLFFELGMPFSPRGTIDKYSYDWTEEVGTVYGCTLDVLTGVLTITHAYTKLPTDTWTLSGVNFWRGLSTLSNTTPANIGWCTHYKSVTNTTGDNTITFGYSSFSASARIAIRDSRFSTASEFMAFLREQDENGTPVMIAYPLATPIEVQLEPHDLASILGGNQIWTDNGTIDVEYRADTKLYIEKLTQPEEDDMIADSAITSGQFFMIGNSLYKALTAIASGATITVGTNAQRVSLADALNLVNT